MGHLRCKVGSPAQNLSQFAMGSQMGGLQAAKIRHEAPRLEGKEGCCRVPGRAVSVDDVSRATKPSSRG